MLPLKVLDFTRLLPGPYAGRLLAERGAAVTKLELPHWPDPVVAFPGLDAELNAKKARVAFDPRKDKERLRALIADSDVFLESSRPGLVKKLGLDWESVHALNPKLVYASIPGFPEGHPLRRVAGHDLNFEALAGLLGDMREPGLPPVPIADLVGGTRLAFEVCAAVLEARATGTGRRLEVSLFEAARELLVIQRAEGDPAPGSRWWNGGDPLYSLYKTQDGKFVAVAALEANFSDRLLELLGLDKALRGEALRAALGAAFAAKTRDAWAEALGAEEVCVQPVLTPAETRS